MHNVFNSYRQGTLNPNKVKQVVIIAVHGSRVKFPKHHPFFGDEMAPLTITVTRGYSNHPGCFKKHTFSHAHIAYCTLLNIT